MLYKHKAREQIYERRETSEEKVSTDMTPESSTTSCGVDGESPEDVQLAHRDEAFLGGGGLVHTAFTSYPPPHA